MLPYISIPFQYASSIIGASPDELKLISSFLISFPLAILLRRIPDDQPAIKNLFSVSVSLFYLVGLFDLWDGIRTIVISSSFTYFAVKYISGPFMPWIVFFFVMGHLSINHLARQFVNDPSIVDVTGAQMILTIKLTSFAWNIADGRLPKKDLTELQRLKALWEIPNPLEYAGFIMFFPSLFAGPAFDYIDYKRWIEMSMFEISETDVSNSSSQSRGKKKRRIPLNSLATILKALSGIFWLALFSRLSVYYFTGFLLGDEYMTYGFFRRVWILHMLNFTTRLKYYGVWALTEAACILSGLGYNGVDALTGKVLWNGLCHVNPKGVETAQNTRALLGNWNINTNNWLRNYIYLRVTPLGKKPGFRASLVTFVTSAFWHGFYPGYYLTFVLASFAQTIAKNFRRYLRPFFFDPQTSRPSSLKPCYDLFSYLATQVAFSFITTPFIYLTLESSFVVWSRVYFYGIIGVGLSFAFFGSPAKSFLMKRLKERNGKKQPANKESHSNSSKSQPCLGITLSPQKDIKEIMWEVNHEMNPLLYSNAKEL